MSYDEPEDEEPENYESEEERLEREQEEFEKDQWERELEEFEGDSEENEIIESENSTEPSDEEQNILDIIQSKYSQLADPSLDEDEKEKIKRELDTLIFQAKKKTEEPRLEFEYDPDYNIYNFARSSFVLSLELSWPKIRTKMDSLMKLIANTRLEYEKIIALRDLIDKFERKYVFEIINSVKPKSRNENFTFESEKFEEIIIDLHKTYDDFFNVFLEDVHFDTRGKKYLKFMGKTSKFRALMLDLRDKKIKADELKQTFEPNFKYCNLDYGNSLGKTGTEEKGFLFQGYWQMEYTLNELRHHTQHWKQDDGKKFLKEDVQRKIEDPISGIESPGNFFILISVLFLVSYHFIDVMQTWIDTDVLFRRSRIKH